MVATNKKDRSKSYPSSPSFDPKKNSPSKNPQTERPGKSNPSKGDSHVASNTEMRWGKNAEESLPPSYPSQNPGQRSLYGEEITQFGKDIEESEASSPYESTMRKKKNKPPKKKNIEGLDNEKLRMNSGPKPGEGRDDEDDDEEGDDDDEIGHSKKGNLFGSSSSTGY